MQPFALTVEKHLIHAAKWHSDTEVVSRGLDGLLERTSYADALTEARRTSALLAGYGVKPGDRVATLCWNTVAHFNCWYAIMGMGGTCHTLNPRIPADHSSVMLDKSGATVVIVSADLFELAHDIAHQTSAKLRFLVAGGRADEFKARGLDAEALDAQIAEVAAPAKWPELDENSECGLCFTSGTTGAPKGVSYTHRASYLHTLRQMQADVTGLTRRDAVLCAVPMFHANAWGLPFAAPTGGSKLVLPGRAKDGRSLADLIMHEEVTVAVGVPTVWIGVLDYLDEHGLEVPSLERIMVGGAPMPAALMRRIEARGIAVQTTWGMTELSPIGTAAPPGDPERDAGKSGEPAIGFDMKLTDEHGCELAQQRDVEGHLWVSGHSVIESYLGESEPATVDGWFCTGDLARIDQRGRLTITGRAKDLIKSGGEWINPAEIEAIVSARSDIVNSAVIGREDAKWSERPILIVEPAAGADPSDDELLGELRDRIASWWMPDAIIRLDAMPLAGTGKIDKLRLRREHGKA